MPPRVCRVYLRRIKNRGGLYDPDTHLVRFGWRDYDPSVGRFTAPDPAKDRRGDGDLYDYCADDPVSRIDPTGLAFWPAIAGIGAAATAARNVYLTRGPAAIKATQDFFSSFALPHSVPQNYPEAVGTATSIYGENMWKELKRTQKNLRKHWDDMDEFNE